jgi:hypothetical protein
MGLHCGTNQVAIIFIILVLIKICRAFAIMATVTAVIIGG